MTIPQNTKPRALPQSWQRAAQVSLLPDGAALGVFGGSRARYGAISDSSGDAIRAEFAGRAIRPQSATMPKALTLLESDEVDRLLASLKDIDEFAHILREARFPRMTGREFAEPR